MFELKVVTRFAAAHQLRMVTKKCENLHGHNWKIELYVAGEELDHTGVLIDFGIIKGHLGEIIDTLDHKFLNELPPFTENNPSSENIARYLAESFQERVADIPRLHVSRVSVWESDDACATYTPSR